MPQGPPSGVLAELYEAVLVLASEQGRIEERLALVYPRMRSMDFAGLPADALARLETLRAELAQMYGSPAAQRTDQNRAVNLALEIILLYDGLAKENKEREGR